MAAQHRTPAYCPHGDRLSRLHRGCDCESAVAIRRPRARGASRGSQNLLVPPISYGLLYSEVPATPRAISYRKYDVPRW